MYLRAPSCASFPLAAPSCPPAISAWPPSATHTYTSDTQKRDPLFTISYRRRHRPHTCARHKHTHTRASALSQSHTLIHHTTHIPQITRWGAGNTTQRRGHGPSWLPSLYSASWACCLLAWGGRRGVGQQENRKWTVVQAARIALRPLAAPARERTHNRIIARSGHTHRHTHAEGQAGGRNECASYEGSLPPSPLPAMVPSPAPLCCFLPIPRRCVCRGLIDDQG